MEDIEDREETEEYGGRRRAFDRDWTKGSILKNLLSLGWPMSVNAILTMLGPTIDMLWVGRLGDASLAGELGPDGADYRHQGNDCPFCRCR